MSDRITALESCERSPPSPSVTAAATADSAVHQRALSVGVAEWDEPYRGRDEIGGERMDVSMEDRRERDLMVRGGDSDGDGKRDRARIGGAEVGQRGAAPRSPS